MAPVLGERAWVFIMKSDDERSWAANRGYDDSAGIYYSYDSNVGTDWHVYGSGVGPECRSQKGASIKRQPKFSVNDSHRRLRRLLRDSNPPDSTIPKTSAPTKVIQRLPETSPSRSQASPKKLNKASRSSARITSGSISSAVDITLRDYLRLHKRRHDSRHLSSESLWEDSDE